MVFWILLGLIILNYPLFAWVAAWFFKDEKPTGVSWFKFLLIFMLIDRRLDPTEERHLKYRKMNRFSFLYFSVVAIELLIVLIVFEDYLV